MTKMIVRPANLPATASEWVRKAKIGLDINDEAEQAGLSLINGGNPEFLRFLNAVHNEDAVEGSIHADDYVAAQMLRNHGRSLGLPLLSNASLEKAKKAQRAWLARYGLDSATRRKSAGSTTPGSTTPTT